MTREEVFERISTTMVEMFELEPGTVTMEANVFEDLDLDSIDAIDLVAKLQQMTGRRVEENALKSVRTVGDIVDLVVAQVEQAKTEGVDLSDTIASVDTALGEDNA